MAIGWMWDYQVVELGRVPKQDEATLQTASQFPGSWPLLVMKVGEPRRAVGTGSGSACGREPARSVIIRKHSPKEAWTKSYGDVGYHPANPEAEDEA